MKLIELPSHVPARALGKLLGVTDRQVRNYSASGLIPAPADGGLYDLSGSVQAILAAKANTKPASEHENAKAMLANQRAEAVALANAKRRGEMVPVADFTAAFDIIMGKFKSQLLSLPAAVTRDREVRRRLEAAIGQAINKTCDEIAKTAAALGAGQ